MIDIISSWWMSGGWGDYKYIITVPFCLGVGVLVGWYLHKERCCKEELAEEFIEKYEYLKNPKL